MARILTLLLFFVFAYGCGDNIVSQKPRGALGDATDVGPEAYVIEALASATAANGAPSGTAGVSANDLRRYGSNPKKFRVAVKSTAGSGTMTVTLKIWQRLAGIGWVVTGALNAGAAIAETGTDTIGYSEAVDAVEGADRYYLEIAAIAGTSTAVTGYIIVGRPRL